jgi:hypothetical protein
MPGLWKAWKAKNRLPRLSTSPLEISPNGCEISTFPQLGRSGLEKWKTKGRFPTFPASLRDYDSGFASQKPKADRSAGCARPRGGGAARRLKSNCR